MLASACVDTATLWFLVVAALVVVVVLGRPMWLLVLLLSWLLLDFIVYHSLVCWLVVEVVAILLNVAVPVASHLLWSSTQREGSVASVDLQVEHHRSVSNVCCAVVFVLLFPVVRLWVSLVLFWLFFVVQSNSFSLGLRTNRILPACRSRDVTWSHRITWPDMLNEAKSLC